VVKSRSSVVVTAVIVVVVNHFPHLVQVQGYQAKGEERREGQKYVHSSS